ncbi:MAG: NUDIX domain-containing protein [Acidobacteria bacterium]|nr:NUDIX domain-containing protein [Acidobacteriota bacterium]
MSGVLTKEQVSAGGVAFRRAAGGRVEVALISVGARALWQLPKGLVGPRESPEAAALREVREEAGVECELLARIDTAEYWYYGGTRGSGGGERVRFHKFVHFYLMRYASGDVADHDAEVNEARWFEIGEACAALAFKTERQIAERARAMIEGTEN